MSVVFDVTTGTVFQLSLVFNLCKDLQFMFSFKTAFMYTKQPTYYIVFLRFVCYFCSSFYFETLFLINRKTTN